MIHWTNAKIGFASAFAEGEDKPSTNVDTVQHYFGIFYVKKFDTLFNNLMEVRVKYDLDGKTRISNITLGKDILDDVNASEKDVAMIVADSMMKQDEVLATLPLSILAEEILKTFQYKANGGIISGDLPSLSLGGNVKWKIGNFETPSHSISVQSKKLPGVKEKVECPFDHPVGLDYPNGGQCGRKIELWALVQQLNDSGWSREKIADWLDELADRGEINIDFSPWEEDKVEDNSVENPCAEVTPTLDGWKDLGYTTLDEATEFAIKSLSEEAAKSAEKLKTFGEQLGEFKLKFDIENFDAEKMAALYGAEIEKPSDVFKLGDNNGS